MEPIPDLLSETVGERTVTKTVDIGGGDAIAVTDSATFVYRADGILSDESIETFDHEVDRLSLKSKRRKSEIRLETMEGQRSVTVPSKVADRVVEAMLQGILRTNGVIEPDEEVLTQFRFSELTLVVTERRLLEHVGGAVWDEDSESVEYEALTGLAFEKGSVATQVVMETETRRRRVKVPNEHAGRVRRAIQDAVFEFHDVSSLKELRAKISVEAEETDERVRTNSEYGVEGGSDTTAQETDAETKEGSFVSADWTPPADQEIAESSSRTTDGNSGSANAPPATSGTSTPGETSSQPSEPDVEALETRVESLAEEVERQTDLIESQTQLLERLVKELRRGR